MFCETSSCNISSPPLSICHNNITQNIDLSQVTSTEIITYWQTHLLQRYDFWSWKILGVCFGQKFKGQMRTGCKLRIWTVVMFASLVQAVNFFSKTSEEYFIVVAFLYFSMLKAVQSVQYTIKQNKYSPQITNVTSDGSCKKNLLVFVLIVCWINFSFTNSRI